MMTITQPRRISRAALFLSIAAVLATTITTAIATARNVSAQATTNEGLSLQVSPSPLFATVKPGDITTLELRIRNTGSVKQDLKMDIRSFTVDDKTGKVHIDSTAPKSLKDYVTFEKPEFTVGPGEIYTQHITISTPKDAGFSYSFATVVEQRTISETRKGTASLHGTVAVFTLVDVDRPGATRAMKLERFAVQKRIYEYLPATINLTLKNTGNTLAQPKGTVYIQRHPSDKEPINAITINDAGGFVLPNTSRTISVDWNDGYPHYMEQKQDPKKSSLSWDGGNISKFRFGKYVAKIVVVYSDGQRDVPLEAEVSFWVIPWRLLAIALLIVLLLVVGIYTTLRQSSSIVGMKALKRRRDAKHESSDK